MPFQFTLRTLLLLFVVVAAALGLGEAWGLAVTLCVAYLVVGVRAAVATRSRGVIPSLAIVSFILLVTLLWAELAQVRPSIHRVQCLSNLKQIGNALYNYHDQYKSFPPAYTTDENGRPMHSWRVLILPYSGEQALYAAFHLDEPWDSPHNRKVAARTPDLFRCPAHESAKPGTTDYVAVTGPGTMWDGDRPCSIRDIADGTSHTLMVIESGGTDIPWNAPQDLPLEDVLTTDPTEAVTSYHEPKTKHVVRTLGCVLLVDGSVDFVPGRPTAESFKASATIADGKRPRPNNANPSHHGFFAETDILPPGPLPGTPSPTVLFWSRLIGWSILVFSFVLLVTRPLPEAWTRRAEKLPEKSVVA